MRPSMRPLQGITVAQVAREEGFELTKELLWSAGGQMQHIFFARTGVQPPKDNRPKTYSKGVHCMAVYTETFRDEIVACLRRAGAEASRQGDLFR